MRQLSSTLWIRLLGYSSEFLNRTRRLLKRGKRISPWIPMVILPLLILLVTGAGLLALYYSSLSRYVSMHEATRICHIYTQPWTIRPGQVLPRDDLGKVLRRLGYRILPARDTQIRARKGAGSPVLDIRFEKAKTGERIVAVKEGGRNRSEVVLDPELLSAVNGSRLERRIYVKFDHLPEHLIQAVLVAEDREFFDHSGIDLSSTLRAAYVNLKNLAKVQGGSTLTQQVAKICYLSSERTFERKFKEAIVAMILERHLSKKEIFELYANEVYMGQVGPFSVVGFGAAARVYFGKHISNLSVPEAALLAGMIKAPNQYSPLEDLSSAVKRRNDILRSMEANGFITPLERELSEISTHEIISPEQDTDLEAHYFTDYLREYIERSGLSEATRQLDRISIETTLEPLLQEVAVSALGRGLAALEGKASRSELQGALVAMDPRSGHIFALVGGREYRQSQLNRATRAYRQLSSTFKPFVYATAFSHRNTGKRLTLATLVEDRPDSFEYEEGDYNPKNFGDDYHGRVALREAIARSLNIPAVRVAEGVGYEAVARLANEIGFNEHVRPYPSLSLGAIEASLLELARAYTVFANGGRVASPRPLQSMRIRGLYAQLDHRSSRRVLKPEVADLVTSALQSVMDSGTGYAARRMGFRLPAAGKTGSSSGDAWFVGYTPELLCAVWVGYDDNRPLGLTGSEAALPIWTYFMLDAQKLGYLKGSRFSRSENIVAVKIDTETGLLASAETEEVRTELFIKGTEPEFLSLPWRGIRPMPMLHTAPWQHP